MNQCECYICRRRELGYDEVLRRMNEEIEEYKAKLTIDVDDWMSKYNLEEVLWLKEDLTPELCSPLPTSVAESTVEEIR